MPPLSGVAVGIGQIARIAAMKPIVSRAPKRVKHFAQLFSSAVRFPWHLFPALSVLWIAEVIHIQAQHGDQPRA
jgi:hypothetical protein